MPAGGLKVQVSVSYSDGFGREIQKKIQAEPGPVVEGGPVVSPRWVGSGWTIFNNKGKPVRQYEPFFDDTHAFRFGHQRRRRLDALLRSRRTHGRHPASQSHLGKGGVRSLATGDLGRQRHGADCRPQDRSGCRRFLPTPGRAEYLPTWHAQRAERRARPEQEQAAAAKDRLPRRDTRGRPCRFAGAHVSHDRSQPVRDSDSAAIRSRKSYATRVVFDIEGNQREVIDAKDRVVMRYDYDMLGTTHPPGQHGGGRTLDAERCRGPADLCVGQPRSSVPHHLRCAATADRTCSCAKARAGSVLIGRTVYGESVPDPEANNLRGKVVQIFDQAGVVTSDEYDFKGNLLASRRQLAREYKTTLDWSADPELEPEIFTSSTDLRRAESARLGHRARRQRLSPDLQRSQPARARWTSICAGRARRHAVRDRHRLRRQGRACCIEYGNGVRTTYEYDPLTFRLDATSRPLRGAAAAVQDLGYTYDPAGNITHIRDNAQQTIYFNNQVVDAQCGLHLRRHLPPDRGDRPRAHRASGCSRRPPGTIAFRVQLPHRVTARQCADTSSGMSTTRSAISCD